MEIQQTHHATSPLPTAKRPVGDWEGRGDRSFPPIQPSDDVMVASVQVMILDEQGKVLAKGGTIKGKDDWWEYVPGAEGRVVVEARNLPGMW